MEGILGRRGTRMNADRDAVVVRHRLQVLLCCGFIAPALLIASAASAIGSRFTYQGQLQQSGVLQNGNCDFQFSLYDAASGGAQIGATQTVSNTPLNNGTFTVELNGGSEFGERPFDEGSDRWLEMAVRCPAGGGSFSAPFTPLQRLTASPFASYAERTRSVQVTNGNTAVGEDALFLNNAHPITGRSNTAVGDHALFSNTEGYGNTAVGDSALRLNTEGYRNTVVGAGALSANTMSIDNTAIGTEALSALITGDLNVALGSFAGSSLKTGNNNIYIRNAGFGDESNVIRIGESQAQTFIAGISGKTAAGGSPVFIDSSGQLGTSTSSARFKRDIRDLGESSTGIYRLRPVAFRYLQEIDPNATQEYGLIAEEVEGVYPEMVTHDGSGRPETVRYQLLTPMLLNELQKQQARIAALEERLEKLAADCGAR